MFGCETFPSGAVVTLFPEFLVYASPGFLMDEIAQKFIHKIYIIRNKNEPFWVHIDQ